MEEPASARIAVLQSPQPTCSYNSLTYPCTRSETTNIQVIHHLLVRRPDGRSPADPIDPVSGTPTGAPAGNTFVIEFQVDGHLLDQKAEHGSLRTLVGQPQFLGLGPGWHDLVAEDGGNRSAVRADTSRPPPASRPGIKGALGLAPRTSRARAPGYELVQSHSVCVHGFIDHTFRVSATSSSLAIRAGIPLDRALSRRLLGSGMAGRIRTSPCAGLASARAASSSARAPRCSRPYQQLSVSATTRARKRLQVHASAPRTWTSHVGPCRSAPGEDGRCRCSGPA